MGLRPVYSSIRPRRRPASSSRSLAPRRSTRNGTDWIVRAEVDGAASARDATRECSRARRVRRKTRLRAESTAGGSVERFFDYVPTGTRPAGSSVSYIDRRSNWKENPRATTDSNSHADQPRERDGPGPATPPASTRRSARDVTPPRWRQPSLPDQRHQPLAAGDPGVEPGCATATWRSAAS